MPILMKNIRVQGIFVGSRAMFEAMNRAIEVGQLHPVVDRVFDFDQAPAGDEVSGKRRSLWRRWLFGSRNQPGLRNREIPRQDDHVFRRDG